MTINSLDYQRQVDRLLAEINCYINFLYIIPNPYTRNAVLNCMRSKVTNLTWLLNYWPVNNGSQPTLPPGGQSFTIGELAHYDGRNGRRAYVAVNGTVYDVTNNAAWAAATHFGLRAGRDLTQEFTRCHPMQTQILSSLPVVGRLAGS